jgi:hypothetical protein
LRRNQNHFAQLKGKRAGSISTNSTLLPSNPKMETRQAGRNQKREGGRFTQLINNGRAL